MLTLDDVLREIGKRDDARGREMVWLAERLQMRLQSVAHWRARGIPAKYAPDIAAALGWTTDRVLGHAAGDQTWPMRRISRSRWESLDDWQRGAIEDAAMSKLRELEAEAARVAVSGKQHRVA